jgi:hypothetical protein
MTKKMTSVLLITGLVTAALLSAGCLSKDEPAAVVAVAPEAIIGTWNKACFAAGDSTYMKSTLVVDADLKGVETYSIYGASDSTCAAANKFAEMKLSMTMKKGDAVAAISGAYQLDFTFTSATMAFTTDGMISNMNAGSMCSITWVKDTAVELTTTCATAMGMTSVPAKDDVFYDIYKIDGTTLTFGTESSETLASRPTALDDTSYTKE